VLAAKNNCRLAVLNLESLDVVYFFRSGFRMLNQLSISDDPLLQFLSGHRCRISFFGRYR
jgi:hypothetical protein